MFATRDHACSKLPNAAARLSSTILIPSARCHAVEYPTLRVLLARTDALGCRKDYGTLPPPSPLTDSTATVLEYSPEVQHLPQMAKQRRRAAPHKFSRVGIVDSERSVLVEQPIQAGAAGAAIELHTG